MRGGRVGSRGGLVVCRIFAQLFKGGGGRYVGGNDVARGKYNGVTSFATGTLKRVGGLNTARV